MSVAGTAPLVARRPVPDAIVELLAELGLSPVQDVCLALVRADAQAAQAVICFAEEETWPDWLGAQHNIHAYTVPDGKGQTIDFQRAMRDQVISHLPNFVAVLQLQG